MSGSALLRGRSRKAAAAAAVGVAGGVVAWLLYPVLGARGGFAVVIAALAAVAVAAGLLLLDVRRGDPLAPGQPLRDHLDASIETVTRDIDAVEQRLKLAMQQYAEQTLAGVHGNYARLEEALGATGTGAGQPPGPGQDGPSPAALPDSADAIVGAQDRVYGQVEGLERVLALLRGDTPAPATYGTWAARPDCLSVLLSLVEERRPGVIVECGSGVSTLVLAKAARAHGGGQVISLEHDPAHAAATAALLERHGVADQVSLRVSDLVEHELAGDEYPWYDLKGLDLPGPVDLLFVDGPPGHTHEQARYPALPLLRDELADDAVIVLDDTRRPDEAHVADRWRQESDGLEPRFVPTQKGTTILAPRR